MDIFKPTYTVEELKNNYNLALLDYEDLKPFAYSMKERLQSFLIHIYLGNIKEEEFKFINSIFENTFLKASNQVNEYLVHRTISSKILSQEEADKINRNLEICETIMEITDHPYIETLKTIKSYFDPITELQKDIDYKIETWNSIKPSIEKITLKILPKHEKNSKRKETIYLQAAALLVHYIDSLVDMDISRHISINSKVLYELGLDDLILKDAKHLPELQETYKKALYLKQTLINNYPELQEKNPYALFLEQDFQDALREYKKYENKCVKKVLLLNGIEAAIVMFATIERASVVPEQLPTSLVLLGISALILNFKYYNEIDRYIESKEKEHSKIEKAHQEYLNGKQMYLKQV